MEQINITAAAADKVRELLAEESNPELRLRMFVQGGGCSGFQYGFTFDEAQNDDDFVIEQQGPVGRRPEHAVCTGQHSRLYQESHGRAV